MTALTFVAVNLMIVLCVYAANRMAATRARSAKVWMWSAAFLGPVPLAVLACFPKKGD